MASLFRKESLDEITSPEQVFDYIRVSRPRIWLALFAMLALSAGGGLWAASGAIPVTESVPAVSWADGVYRCFLPAGNTGRLAPGSDASIDGKAGVVYSVGTRPVSREDAAKIAGGEYMVYALRLSDWNVFVEIHVEADAAADSHGSIHDAVVVTDVVQPINYFFN